MDWNTCSETCELMGSGDGFTRWTLPTIGSAAEQEPVYSAAQDVASTFTNGRNTGLWLGGTDGGQWGALTHLHAYVQCMRRPLLCHAHTAVLSMGAAVLCTGGMTAWPLGAATALRM